jgi:hypothetical protein
MMRAARRTVPYRDNRILPFRCHCLSAATDQQKEVHTGGPFRPADDTKYCSIDGVHTFIIERLMF